MYLSDKINFTKLSLTQFWQNFKIIHVNFGVSKRVLDCFRLRSKKGWWWLRGDPAIWRMFNWRSRGCIFDITPRRVILVLNQCPITTSALNNIEIPVIFPGTPIILLLSPYSTIFPIVNCVCSVSLKFFFWSMSVDSATLVVAGNLWGDSFWRILLMNFMFDLSVLRLRFWRL